jgi:ppGpp synthetase/RelA/SpoT-type nucleotidyltranferase
MEGVAPAKVKEHAEKSLLKYVEVRDLYSSYADSIKSILESALKKGTIHTIQARAKDFSSFAVKASKIDEQTGDLKYQHPIEEITDIAGIRVITYVPQGIKEVEDVIRQEFDVEERLDKDAELLGSGQIGYKSIHFLIKLKEPRVKSTEYSRYQLLTAEIQVRTILQHAWAEMEHDIQYKSDQQIPIELKRRFVALAGLLEIADREFQSIQQEDERLRKQIRIELNQALSKLDASEDASEVRGVEHPASESAAQASPSNQSEAGVVVALERYNKLIQTHPEQYANFVGRAKAKFLLGDRSGALRDLDEAERLSPGNEQVASVRQKIEEGRLVGATSASVAAQHASSGNRSLSQGNVSEAKLSYREAEELGQIKVHSSFNLAMCACIEGDIEEVERLLGTVTPHKGSFIEINHLALRIIAHGIKKDFAPEIISAMQSDLSKMIRNIGVYGLEMSPLRILMAAMRLPAYEDVNAAAAPVFAILSSADSGAPAK